MKEARHPHREVQVDDEKKIDNNAKE